MRWIPIFKIKYAIPFYAVVYTHHIVFNGTLFTIYTQKACCIWDMVALCSTNGFTPTVVVPILLSGAFVLDLTT